jgi:hypothetical protein
VLARAFGAAVALVTVGRSLILNQSSICKPVSPARNCTIATGHQGASKSVVDEAVLED